MRAARPVSSLLLHICCAPCAVGAIKHFQKTFSRIVPLFYNPNIHPYTEFRKRLKAVKVLAERLKNIEFRFVEEYGLFKFLPAVLKRLSRRCEICYKMRLGYTAKTARDGGFDSFSTTLLISDHQDIALIRRIGERFGNRFGVRFVSDDIRHLHQEALAEAKRMSLYRQKFCGCIFSEFERYSGSVTP